MAHLVYQPKRLIQSCFDPRASSALASLASSVHNPPGNRVRHRNFSFGWPYVTIKYDLVIQTCSFEMAAILVLFFDLLSYPHRQSYRLILHILTYLFFTYIHKRNNTTEAFFLKFMGILLKCIYSLLL